MELVVNAIGIIVEAAGLIDIHGVIKAIGVGVLTAQAALKCVWNTVVVVINVEGVCGTVLIAVVTAFDHIWNAIAVFIGRAVAEVGQAIAIRITGAFRRIACGVVITVGVASIGVAVVVGIDIVDVADAVVVAVSVTVSVCVVGVVDTITVAVLARSGASIRFG